MKNFQVGVLVATLISVGCAIVYLKVTELGMPLLPGQSEEIWSIESTVEFSGGTSAVIVDLDIPDDFGDFVRLDEYFVARDYGLNIQSDKGGRRAQWSKRRANGKQRLYYRAEIAPRIAAGTQVGAKSSVPAVPNKPAYEEPLASAVADVLGEVRAESANVFTFVSQLLSALNDAAPDTNVRLIRGNIEIGSAAWVERLIHVLAGARISARMVRGVMLDDGTSNQTLIAWLEVHNGSHWQGFDPSSGATGFPPQFVRWSVGSDPVLSVENGRGVHLSFAVSRYSQSLARVATDRAAVSESWLSNLLLFKLPVSAQNVYRVLLMIPLGALVVALMRTVIGIPTLGTFMPILIAIAFRETELLWGVILFIGISALGLSMRIYLDRLRLLLVPRLCAVLVLVVLLMLVISLLSARLELVRGFSIALFPIVILTMVIEHMSVVWEESGALATLKEGLGSLVVAILGYLVMTNEYLSHFVFLFPEILLVLLGLFIIIGRYTGYRVTEIIRFRDIVEDRASDVRQNT